ncbi:zonadhesin-like [Cyclopterus lumpus]|uniref:zonadhesin-like n=1 Tax=Cyclopterus lumpus TaxID=8103 RepID=UPI001486AB80|nr:zonadhesin-like [Cyclopterus lumpus]
MACGVPLGILLICLVQAEHVRCLWATQARGQSGNTYVGFSQQRGGLAGSYPQNRPGQASGSPGFAQSSGFNTNPEVSSGHSQRFPSSRYTQTASRPAQRGFASGKLAPSGSESKPDWPPTKLNEAHVQKMPKKQPFAFSGSIAGGSSLSKYNRTPISKKRPGPGQQGSPGTSPYRSSSSASLQKPRESFKSSAVSETPASSGREGYSTESSSPSGAGASRRIPVRTKTSASAAARRVSSRRSSVGYRPRPDSSQTLAVNPYTSKRVPVNVRDPPSSKTSSTGTSGQGFAPSTTHNIPQRFGGFAIRRLKEPADQKVVSVREPQQTYVAPQRPLAPPLHQVYAAPQRPLAPPHRRPLAPLHQASVVPQQPLALQHQVYVAPQRLLAPPHRRPYVASQRPLAPLHQASVMPQQPLALQHQVYVAPQQPLAPPHRRPYVAALQHQAYVAPQRPSASYRS